MKQHDANKYDPQQPVIPATHAPYRPAHKMPDVTPPTAVTAPPSSACTARRSTSPPCWQVNGSASRKLMKAFGSSASATTISDISTSSRKPCNPSTTHSVRSLSPMSPGQLHCSDRDALVRILGTPATCSAAPSRQSPEARRGAPWRAGLTAKARAEQQWPRQECVVLRRIHLDAFDLSNIEPGALQTFDDPIGTRLSPMSPERSVTHVSGLDK
jgi:hypothetical protein